MAAQSRLILLVTGLLLLVGSAMTAVRTSRFIAHAASGDGIVAHLNAGGSHPQIAFSANGVLISYPQGGMIAGFRTGQAVQVLYDPAQPQATARVRSFGSLWGSSTALAICGVGLLALAFLDMPVIFYRK